MKIDNRFDPTAYCDPNSPREIFTYVLIEEFSGHDVAIATDGFGLSVVPVDLELGEVRGLVHWSAFKLMPKRVREQGMRLLESEIVFANGWRAPRIAVGHSVDTDSFGNWSRNVERAEARDKVSRAFCFDTALLRKAERALGDGHLAITRGSDTGAMLVRPMGRDDSFQAKPPFVLVMPMMTHMKYTEAV